MWQFFALLSVGIGFWLWMQKKMERTKSEMQDSFKALSLDALKESTAPRTMIRANRMI